MFNSGPQNLGPRGPSPPGLPESAPAQSGVLFVVEVCSPGSILVFNAQICIIPHSRDTSLLIVTVVAFTTY